VLVRALDDEDQSWKLATLERGWGTTAVARLAELVDAAPLSGFVAIDGAERVGLLTYVDRGDGIEVVTVQALDGGRGVGRALMDAAYALAVQRAAPRLWLITTNDNLRALAFYQRWGMDLRRVIRDGVDDSMSAEPR
jgi:ribosomal protein S18 acetylase RimI-like enzyme